MQKSLYNQRTTMRGDNILHNQSTHSKSSESIEQESNSHSSNSPLDSFDKKESMIAPSSSVSSQTVISRFIESNGDHVQSIHAEPLLLVANKTSQDETTKTQQKEQVENMIQNLPSGHRVEFIVGEEKIQVFDQNEKLQVSITLTKRGPLVQLDGAKIQMRSASDIDLNCDNLRVHTNEDLHLNAAGELTIESTEELHINCEMDIRMRGKIIWLN